MATSGSGPASANAKLSATGSLSICTTPSSSPSSFWRTISDRRACRSMATYCRSTGLLLVRERVGFAANSFVWLKPFPKGEDPPLDRRSATQRLPRAHHQHQILCDLARQERDNRSFMASRLGQWLGGPRRMAYTCD